MLISQNDPIHHPFAGDPQPTISYLQKGRGAWRRMLSFVVASLLFRYSPGG